ncbi:DUF3231 family protein [Priestia endophytica]|uniref:DUF3231 family protein n=1 Tax=Priestia endophytica TaxID=135735 RepID=UPI000DCA550B|nr:DUF3231 family protein [Priestia endophytica]RAS80279.1 hypothetical protein A4U60_16555 [Priestia endophytica]
MEITQHSSRLTASELSNLWTSYMNDSMASCVLKYMIEKAEDQDVKSILEFALELAQKHISELTKIFNAENVPIPQGFTDHDVDLKAPRLFSDTFSLIYLQNMARIGLLAYGMALPLMAHKDASDYYHKCLSSSAELGKKLTHIMLEKGVYTRSPYIPTPQRVEFIEQQSFMNGWFGKQRPLTGVEVTDIHMCLLSNTFSKVLVTGYAQVAKDQKIRKYFEKGKEIVSKQIEVFNKMFQENDLSAPPTWDSEVTESTIPPFSDKLMVFHSRILSMAGIGNYGLGVATSMRHDLIPQFLRLAAELGKYGDKGVEIMIKHKWLEQPPLASDRDQLINP